jgi:Secretion system C-terminal sorting domain
MCRLLGLTGLVCLLHGSIGSCAMAQGFSTRFDTIGSGYYQVGWAVHENDSAEFIISSNGGWVDWVDSLYYSSTVTMLIVNASGELVNADHILTTTLLTYPGMMGSMVRLPDGRYVIGGGTFAAGWIQVPALYWFDANGEALGFVQVDTLVDYLARQVGRASDGGFVLVGDAYFDDVGQGFLLKTDSAGVLQWVKTYGTEQWRDGIFAVDNAPGGGYYLGGVKGVGPDSYDPWLMRCDSLGNVIWETTHGTQYNDLGRACVTTLADGNFVYGSGLPNGIASDHQPQLAKVDSLGNVVWEMAYDTATFSAIVNQVKEVSPGGDLIACGFSQPITPYNDGFLLRTTSEGDSIWLRHYWYFDSLTHNSTGIFNDVTPTSDGGFIAVGAVYGAIDGVEPPGSNQDVWVLKVDSLGCIIPGCDDFSTVVTVQATNLGSALSVYPNPARASTTVKVTLPAGSPFAKDLRLRLVSAEGKEVLEQKAGLGENQLPLHELVGGIYYLHLTNGSTWLSGTKLIVE